MAKKTTSAKGRRSRPTLNEETAPLATNDTGIIADAIRDANLSPTTRHPNGAGLGGDANETNAVVNNPDLTSSTGETTDSATDMRDRARLAGLDENYTTGVGSGASPVGTGGVGMSDDDIRSDDDPRVNSDMNSERGGNIGKSVPRMNGGSITMQNDQTLGRNTSGRTVAAIFDDWNAASRAVNELHAANFTDQEIGIARMDKEGHTTQRSGTVADDKDQAKGVASGVATGAAVGGVAGLLAALASLAIPGVGPIVAGGVLATTFGTAAGAAVTGAGIGAGVGAAAGGLVGAMTGVGLSEDEARVYDERLRSGGTLVTVSAGDRSIDALGILQRSGGHTYDRDTGSIGSSAGSSTRGETF